MCGCVGVWGGIDARHGGCGAPGSMTASPCHHCGTRPMRQPLGHQAARGWRNRDHFGLQGNAGWAAGRAGCHRTQNDPPRTRTWNLRLRRPTPYPLGQRAMWSKRTRMPNYLMRRKMGARRNRGRPTESGHWPSTGSFTATFGSAPAAQERHHRIAPHKQTKTPSGIYMSESARAWILPPRGRPA